MLWVTDNITALPEIINDHWGVTVAIYVMYYNKFTFIASTSWRILLVMEDYVNDRSNSNIMALINKSIKIYFKCMFKFTTLLVNP